MEYPCVRETTCFVDCGHIVGCWRDWSAVIILVVNTVDSRFIYPVGVKACGKLTVLCHIAVLLINMENNGFSIIFSYGILLVDTSRCVRHVAETLCCAFNRYEHPAFSWHDLKQWWGRMLSNKLLALLRTNGEIQLILGSLKSLQWLCDLG